MISTVTGWLESIRGQTTAAAAANAGVMYRRVFLTSAGAVAAAGRGRCGAAVTANSNTDTYRFYTLCIFAFIANNFFPQLSRGFMPQMPYK